MPAPINPEDISHQIDLGISKSLFGGDTISAKMLVDHKGKPTIFVTIGDNKKFHCASFSGHSGTRAFLEWIEAAQEKIEYILNHKPEVTNESKPAQVLAPESLSAPSDN